MKHLVFVFFLLLATINSTLSQNSSINVNYWFAFASSYKEVPEVGSPGAELGNIWGKFGTHFIQVDPRIQVLKRLTLNPRLRYGSIMSNRMFIYNDNSFLTIGGSIVGIEADLDFNIIQNEELRFALFAGFVLYKTNKEFYDYQENNVILKPGNFGYYKSTMIGPHFGVKGEYNHESNFGVEASVSTSPVFENDVTVAGWTTTPKEDYATGYKFGLEILARYNLSSVIFKFGYKGENIYFGSSENDKYNLTLGFSGIVGSVGYHF